MKNFQRGVIGLLIDQGFVFHAGLDDDGHRAWWWEWPGPELTSKGCFKYEDTCYIDALGVALRTRIEGATRPFRRYEQ